MSTAAQEEFNDLVAKNTHRETLHPEDRNDSDLRDIEDLDEEDTFRNNQIDAAMRMPTMDRLTGAGATEIKLPPASFDSGRSTGVKGVIADARNYEAARKNKWRHRVRTARNSIFGIDAAIQPPPGARPASPKMMLGVMQMRSLSSSSGERAGGASSRARPTVP
ncbi:hypothetical protein NW754_005329 [Fusarium falciforme]|nr:hypothetical protein NW754_005329 [Fusarium falciforme]